MGCSRFAVAYFGSLPVAFLYSVLQGFLDELIITALI